jgi:DNA replication protein DnaC
LHQLTQKAPDEKDSICPPITGSTSDKPLASVNLNGRANKTMTIQKIYDRMKERQTIIAASKPEDLMCRQCGRLVSPIWNHIEGHWGFPELTDNGICKQCRKLLHIRQNIEAYLQKSGVPPKYLKCSFENFHVIAENRGCVSACRQYLAHHRPDYPGLYLFGNCGTGKTHLAAAITRDLLLTGQPVTFTCVPRLCFEVRKVFDGDLKITEHNAIKAYTSCEYLVLDDLGAEKPTEWVKKTLGYIIYERDNMFKPTIITSNLSLDEIASHIDPRISSRIAGMGRIIHVQGPDWRLNHPLRQSC